MLTTTHALVPVAVGAAVSVASQTRRRVDRLFTRGQLVMIAVAGALPDLLSPHWRLSARWQSPTHSVWCALVLYPACIVAAACVRGSNRVIAAHLAWFGIWLHLAMDAVSGGIAWLYPWRPDIIGGHFISFPLWFLSDLIFGSLVFYLLYRINRIEMEQFAATTTALKRS